LSFPVPGGSPSDIASGSDGALWFTEPGANKIGRITTAGVVTEFPVPTANSGLAGIAKGSDGSIWFTERVANKIGRITTAGVVTEFTVPTAGSMPSGIAAGADRALWFTESATGRVVRITTGGVFTEFSVSTANSNPGPIAASFDNALWFVERGSNKLGRVTTLGDLNEFSVAANLTSTTAITGGPDGALWFVESANAKIGRFTTAGQFTEFPVPPGLPQGIAAGLDGELWFTDNNVLGRIDTHGAITQNAIPNLGRGDVTGGITLGPDDALWFTDPGHNAIWRAAAPLNGPLLSVTSSHDGSFLQGQSVANFRLSVRNAGVGPTTAAVTLTDALPGGFTATAMIGPGWTCTLATVSCTRSDVLPLGASYPPIVLTVSVVQGVASPVYNQVNVTGGGAPDVTASDSVTLLPAFTDINPQDVYLPAINMLRESGITTGCGPTIYCPNDNIPESQMAVFVTRSVAGSDNFVYSQIPYFTDVPANHPYFPWIQRMEDTGIALPCSPTMYCPDTPVTRAIMAVLIIRARFGTSIPTNYPTTPYFTDVPMTHLRFAWIQKMKQAGITTGCTPTTYCPEDPVTRGQMAVFIMRGVFNQLLAPNTPMVVWTTPSSAPAGQLVTVTVVGQNTHFDGTSRVTAGPGIAVSNVNVVDASTLTVQLNVVAGAAAGPRSITVITGAEEATLPNGFQVQ